MSDSKLCYHPSELTNVMVTGVLRAPNQNIIGSNLCWHSFSTSQSWSGRRLRPVNVMLCLVKS